MNHQVNVACMSVYVATFAMTIPILVRFVKTLRLHNLGSVTSGMCMILGLMLSNCLGLGFEVAILTNKYQRSMAIVRGVGIMVCYSAVMMYFSRLCLRLLSVVAVLYGRNMRWVFITIKVLLVIAYLISIALPTEAMTTIVAADVAFVLVVYVWATDLWDKRIKHGEETVQNQTRWYVMLCMHYAIASLAIIGIFAMSEAAVPDMRLATILLMNIYVSGICIAHIVCLGMDWSIDPEKN